MYDRELALEILTQIYESTQTILKRFEPVKSVEDFTDSDGGMEKLDSICMQLIAIGEGLKNLDKVTNTDLVIHIIQSAGDLYITRDCKLIGHQFGLGSGFRVQSSGLTALHFFP
ncbi:MAG: hypothetical protein U9R17_04515 [Thermodesulfobacteriota bacterium]|nr:hypothetical protein [Thermodesulfobacteriota bacterium]